MEDILKYGWELGYDMILIFALSMAALTLGTKKLNKLRT